MVLQDLGRRLARAGDFCQEQGRPFVTLAYAQSLDGSIAAIPGQKLNLSCEESLKLTHELRAKHDGILVGIGTVLSDNPRLDVRLSSGDSPQVVLVDSALRTPPEAAVFEGRLPWVACTEAAADTHREPLEAAGARLITTAAMDNGWVDLRDLLGRLAKLGMTSLMVEGGAAIISSLMEAALVDHVVITVSPIFVGGVPAASGGVHWSTRPRLEKWTTHRVGVDLIIEGGVVSP